jgi:ribosome-associated protein
MTTPADRAPGPEWAVSVAVDLPITLGQFVKLAGLASTGGDAKRLVTEGLVRVNAEIETRRGHKLVPGDVVEVQGAAAKVVTRPAGSRSEGPQPAGPGSTPTRRPFSPRG